jgi:polyisoprenoid-binding protein YceI
MLNGAREEIMTRNRFYNHKWRLRILGLTVLALALLSPAAAQQTQIKFDPARTRVEWTLGDVLHTVQGTFQLKSGTIQFDSQLATPAGK